MKVLIAVIMILGSIVCAGEYEVDQPGTNAPPAVQYDGFRVDKSDIIENGKAKMYYARGWFVKDGKPVRVMLKDEDNDGVRSNDRKQIDVEVSFAEVRAGIDKVKTAEGLGPANTPLKVMQQFRKGRAQAIKDKAESALAGN